MNNHGSNPEELNLVERLAIGYLALPVAIFYLGWLQPLYGITCTLLLMLLVLPRFRSTMPAGLEPHSLATICLVIFVAVMWSCLGGAGHLFYANFDWPTRDAVMRDLVQFPWPVNYATSPESLVLLRAPIGYYLVPAIIGKAVGLVYADYLLLGWTVIGVAILFLIIASLWQKRWQLFLVIAVFILFSGMDIVGSYLMGDPINQTAHLEGWSKYFQYSSMTTVLYWVPNHGLPGWLSAGLIVRNWQKPTFVPTAIILTTILPLWSPLTAAGVFLLCLALLVFHCAHGEWRKMLSPGTIVACIIAVPIMSYLTLKTDQIDSGWFFCGFNSFSAPLLSYALFIIIELAILPFTIYGELKFRSGHWWLTVAASCFLLMLPCYSFGMYNDLVMRGSIPLLAVIALRSAAVLITSIERHAYLFASLVTVILAIGSVVPVLETNRVLGTSRWKPDLTHDLVTVTNNQASHYYVKLRYDEVPAIIKKSRLR